MHEPIDLHAAQAALGAQFAPDGIPLHYGNAAGEYQAAHSGSVLMERSHEGRLLLSGRDRLALVQRMSTNDVATLTENHGCPTIFTSPVARILDRVVVFAHKDETRMLTEPGRGAAVSAYIGRNIFFNDDVKLADLSGSTRQFNLHGVTAENIIVDAFPGLQLLALFACAQVEFDGVQVWIARLKPLIGSHYVVHVPNDHADALWTHLLSVGNAHGLQPAGSLTYNVLRIEAGRPGVGRELSGDYLPLEVGLWDEVSFTKGCYTGQEIIARMESRRRLAKTIVAIKLSAMVEAPAAVYADGHEIGRLTSSVSTPDGTIHAIGVVKLSTAHEGTPITVGEHGITATIGGRLGVLPEFTEAEE
ncbi:MAG: folate-binding protein YgfZ [Anaerolineae bacterium]